MARQFYPCDNPPFICPFLETDFEHCRSYCGIGIDEEKPEESKDCEKEEGFLGYCECCGIPIYEHDIHTRIDGNYYCDYCGGEDGLSISEMEDEKQ